MRKCKSNDRRRGVAIYYFVIVMAALCLFVSLAVDLARVQVAKTELMRAADAGSRAAAATVPEDLTTARSNAQYFGALNNSDGAAVSIATNDIEFGTWNTVTRTWTSLSLNHRPSTITLPTSGESISTFRCTANRPLCSTRQPTTC